MNKHLKNNIIPVSISKNISNIIDEEFDKKDLQKTKTANGDKRLSPEEYINYLENQMKDAAANLEFEDAAKIRDKIKKLERKHLGLKIK